MRHLILAAAIAATPLSALAVGSESSAPPTPTATSTECKDGQVWDEKEEKCVDPEQSGLSDETLMLAARELAWAERYDDSLRVLAAIGDQSNSMVQTYYGFSYRKAGQVDRGLTHYAAALKTDPDNILARSYLGMAYVELGLRTLAVAQLNEIRARGGEGSWPETALVQSLIGGKPVSY